MKKLKYCKKTIILIAAAAGIFSLLNCSNPSISTGGSEAGNAKIAGKIIDKDGCPAANTIVTILPSDYNPLTNEPIADSCIDTTDTNGIYHFTVAENHVYSIEAVQQHSLLRALITGIPVGTEDSSIEACKLSLPGTVRILVSNENLETPGYIYIPGTSFFVKVTTENEYTLLDSIPSGVIPSILYTSTDGSSSIIMSHNVKVTPGDTTIVLWPDWKYSHEIILNTSPSGADISEDVINFPVLVRLSADNFDFNQSMPQGEDLRFISLSGKRLSHDIELWDRENKHAAIWVKVDTILGNNAKQSITMIWGNPSAAAPLKEKPVFDTTEGFEGVWHLGEAAESFLDVTDNHYDGTSPDTCRPQQQKGIIGNCQKFDGNTDYIIMPNTASSKLNFPMDGYFTISAWVSIDTLGYISQLIVSKGYSQYFLRFTYFPSDSPLWEFSVFTSPNIWQACTSTAYARQWSLITGVRAGNRHLLYVNGTLVDSLPNSYNTSTLSRDTSQNVTVGRFMQEITLPNNTNNYCFFKGAIDEVRIENGARSNAWVKLCYMNQRSDDRLVVFK